MGSPAISNKQVTIVMIGALGPPGARKHGTIRFAITPGQYSAGHSAKANRVPIFDRSAKVPISEGRQEYPRESAIHVEKSGMQKRDAHD